MGTWFFKSVALVNLGLFVLLISKASCPIESSEEHSSVRKDVVTSRSILRPLEVFADVTCSDEEFRIAQQLAGRNKNSNAAAILEICINDDRVPPRHRLRCLVAYLNLYVDSISIQDLINDNMLKPQWVKGVNVGGYTVSGPGFPGLTNVDRDMVIILDVVIDKKASCVLYLLLKGQKEQSREMLESFKRVIDKRSEEIKIPIDKIIGEMEY